MSAEGTYCKHKVENAFKSNSFEIEAPKKEDGMEFGTVTFPVELVVEFVVKLDIAGSAQAAGGSTLRLKPAKCGLPLFVFVATPMNAEVVLC